MLVKQYDVLYSATSIEHNHIVLHMWVSIKHNTMAAAFLRWHYVIHA